MQRTTSTLPSEGECFPGDKTCIAKLSGTTEPRLTFGWQTLQRFQSRVRVPVATSRGICIIKGRGAAQLEGRIVFEVTVDGGALDF
jgi:hypothetical protein